jgi:hypothetical protein
MEELGRSLNIPRKESSPSYKEYVEYPKVQTLDQIMINYLDMEEILKLYNQDHKPFETRLTLDTLSNRFNLPRAKTFKELLESYDTKYATVRSYHYKGRTPEEILLQAAEEGDIQAFYNGLKLYSGLRNKDIYNKAVKRAALGGHIAIINLLLDLGADNYNDILDYASQGGHLDIVMMVIKDLYYGKLKYVDPDDAIRLAAEGSHINVLDYLINHPAWNPKYFPHPSDLANLGMEGAGFSGDEEVIDYLISKGADHFTDLLSGAVEGNHLDLVKKYHDMASVGSHQYFHIFHKSAKRGRLDIVKFFVEKGAINRKTLNSALLYATKNNQDEVVKYLKNQRTVR